MRSLCAVKNQAECHYRRRQPPRRPSDISTSRLTSTSTARHLNPGQDGIGGQSFWRAVSGTAGAAAELEHREVSDEEASAAGDRHESGHLLPFKRSESSSMTCVSSIFGRYGTTIPHVQECDFAAFGPLSEHATLLLSRSSGRCWAVDIAYDARWFACRFGHVLLGLV